MQAFAIEDSFDISKTDRYHLSIQSNLDGLCFCILDLDNNTYVALKKQKYNIPIVDYNDLQKAVATLIEQEPLLQNQYKSSICMHNTRRVTLIPRVFAEKHLLKSFLEFTCPLNELDEIHTQPIKVINAEAIYAIPSPIACKLHEKLPNIRFCHQSAPMINLLEEQVNQQNVSELFLVNINDGFADIALYARGGLKIYNTFEINAPSDLIFFLLYMARQHKVNEKKVTILLSGNIGTYVKELAEVFPHLSQARASEKFSYAKALYEYADHRFANLFALYQCV
jgi:hypothetical protein